MQASLFIIDCIDIYFYSRYYIEDLSMISFMAGNGGLVHWCFSSPIFTFQDGYYYISAFDEFVM